MVRINISVPLRHLLGDTPPKVFATFGANKREFGKAVLSNIPECRRRHKGSEVFSLSFHTFRGPREFISHS